MVLTPTQVGPYLLRRGWVAWPCVYLMHRSRALWDEPDVFRPERFLPGKAATLDHRTGAAKFMPFSLGTKDCLGQVSWGVPPAGPPIHRQLTIYYICNNNTYVHCWAPPARPKHHQFSWQ